MSNATAIAAVTGALCALFNKIPGMEGALSDLKVSAVPPDQAGTETGNSSLNVFLYQVSTNAAFRNMSVPRQFPAGSTASPPPDVPPVALDLDYLITAYGKDSDDTLAHLALAEVVSLLADNACLSPQLIQAAVVNSAITGIDLEQQRERVRVTPKPLTIEEISKLWTIFQAKYRISVSYQVSVVLIDSAQPPRAPLPVASYGVGVVAPQAPLTWLSAITLPNGRPIALLGDTVVLSRINFGGVRDTLSVLFQSPLVAAPFSVAVTAQSPGSVTVTIPNDAGAQAAWPAGPYVVAVCATGPAPAGGGAPRTYTSNALALALAPRIVAVTVTSSSSSSSSSSSDSSSSGSTIVVQCSPEVWPQQRVSLLVGDAEIALPSIAAPTAQLSFPAGDLPAGTYFVRLRVDGVDSVLADYTKTPPVLDVTQQVTLP